MFDRNHTHKTNHGKVGVALRNLRRMKKEYEAKQIHHAEFVKNNSVGRKCDAENLNMLRPPFKTKEAEFWLKVKEDGCWKTRVDAHWWRLWTLRR